MIEVTIPVVVKGEPKGVKQQGGLLEFVRREIAIECLPDEIPESFVVDVTELMLGQSIRAADLALTGSMLLLAPPETVLAHVVALRAEEAPAEAAAVAPEAGAAAPGTEPEVIKKGKKEEEAAAEEKKKK
jgi:large subunit ribosomal protein L25